MTEILSGSATPAQIAAFIVALRMKGETSEELSGLLGAMLGRRRARWYSSDLAGSTVIDIVGTGGDKHHSINVSTLAALVVAGAGGRVCKHGNRAASSACGSADLLEALGVVIDLAPEGVARCVERAGIGFCFAPRYHPSMRHAGPVRRELGVPTLFNFLGPLANPARARRYVVGVSDETMADRMAHALADHGAERAWVVYGGDGLDEITTTTSTNVVELRDGDVHAMRVDPTDFGMGQATLDDLRGGDPATNAQLARQVLAGDDGATIAHIVVVERRGSWPGGAAGLVPTPWRHGVNCGAASIDDGSGVGRPRRARWPSRWPPATAGA